VIEALQLVLRLFGPADHAVAGNSQLMMLVKKMAFSPYFCFMDVPVLSMQNDEGYMPMSPYFTNTSL
jgi:hypothetical protein